MLINRNYGLLWIGQTVSNIGDAVFDTTLVLWIASRIAQGQSWAPLAVSGVLIATALPTLVIGPLAGVFVDRWDKRLTMLRMDSLRALLIVALLLLTPLPFVDGSRLPGGWQLAAIYLVVVLATAAAQFFSPSRLTLIGDVVDEDQQARATGLGQATQSLSIVIGPPLAALLFFSGGVQWALLINALSFMVSFLAVALIRVPRAAAAEQEEIEGRFFLTDLANGLTYFRGNRVLTTVLIAVTIAMFGAGALNALDYFFIVRNLHAAPSLYGFIGTAQGIGAIVGAVLAAVWAQRLGVTRTFWSSVLVLSALILVYARLTSFAPALALAFLIGLPTAALNVAVGPLILRNTPRAYIGRVVAVLTPMMSLASIVSIAVAGYLTTTLANLHATVLGFTIGPIDAIFTAAAVLVAAAGFYAAVRLRGLERPMPAAEAAKP
jgi:MFS family permease